MTNPVSRLTTAELPERIVLSGRAVADLVQPLDHCHAFLDSNPSVQAQLREYCLPQTVGMTPFWVIDRLAWHALLLGLQLIEQAAESFEHDYPGQ